MSAVQRPSDGVSGEYAPAPADHPFLRRSGGGLDGLDPLGDVERREQAAMIHAGQLLSVHSWELVTAVDGPGTRMTTFLSGCPLSCLYCHNPDTMDMRRGTLVPTDELCQRIYRYRRIFARTGGGITISGGEPLMQPRGVSEILQFARDNDIHTAIDTSGFLGVRCSDAMMRNLNLVLLDIKSGVPEVYKRTTNQELGPTLEFAQRLGVAQVPVWVRFVLVPGLTDDRDNIERVAEIASSIPSLERVEVLPFHQMGRDKWEALGFDYKLEETKPPTAEATEQARDIFRRRGIATY
ncbi:pyruvate formate-lyase-activating protein [Schaalia sp. JY-X159]|jgi:pyruvate formate lyase activating enzyme|uniref:pyruvate formate-lyase-activating protein n=1 Tax=Schaalia sp. JY-X159 TaxID=2758575 RepID=UPI00165D9C71|nr:pyruvate formate-lyase-activating protein [Schaalia sp. JY-X159]